MIRLLRVLLVLVSLAGISAVPSGPASGEVNSGSITTTCSKKSGVVTCRCEGAAACKLMTDNQCKNGRSYCSGTSCECEMKRIAPFAGKGAVGGTGAGVDATGGN